MWGGGRWGGFFLNFLKFGPKHFGEIWAKKVGGGGIAGGGGGWTPLVVGEGSGFF